MNVFNYFFIAIIAVLSVVDLTHQTTTSTSVTGDNNKISDVQPRLIHTVFFWTKEDATEGQKLAFEEGLKKLGTCPQIASYYWGPPADTGQRDVIDHSYDYAINVHFASMEKHDEYQDEPIHKEFIENHQHIWDKVLVYDNQAR